MAGESPSGASAAPHWPRKRLPAPPPLAPGGCSLRGRGALSRRRRCSPPPRGRARREEARALDGSGSLALPLAAAPASAPPPSRSKRQSERVRRRQRAGPARRGRGLLAVTPPASWIRSAHLPPRAALLFPPEPAPRSGWDSPAPRPGPRAPRLVTPSSPSALACSGREGSAEQGCAELGAPSGRGRKAPSLGVSVTASLPGPSG